MYFWALLAYAVQHSAEWGCSFSLHTRNVSLTMMYKLQKKFHCCILCGICTARGFNVKLRLKSNAPCSCFVLFWYCLDPIGIALWLTWFYSYPSGLLHWHWGNRMIAPMSVKQPWGIWTNAWYESNKNYLHDHKTPNQTKQQTHICSSVVRLLCKSCHNDIYAIFFHVEINFANNYHGVLWSMQLLFFPLPFEAVIALQQSRNYHMYGVCVEEPRK